MLAWTLACAMARDHGQRRIVFDCIPAMVSFKNGTVPGDLAIYLRNVPANISCVHQKSHMGSRTMDEVGNNEADIAAKRATELPNQACWRPSFPSDLHVPEMRNTYRWNHGGWIRELTAFGHNVKHTHRGVEKMSWHIVRNLAGYKKWRMIRWMLGQWGFLLKSWTFSRKIRCRSCKSLHTNHLQWCLLNCSGLSEWTKSIFRGISHRDTNQLIHLIEKATPNDKLLIGRGLVPTSTMKDGGFALLSGRLRSRFVLKVVSVLCWRCW